MKTIDSKASYVVGRPWHPNNSNSAICTYTYFGEVHHGTIGEAIEFRDYCNKKNPKEKYRIYQVVEVPGSEDFTKDNV